MHDLVSETLRLARQSNLTVAKICKAAEIKPRWYYKFVAGEFSDPGVNKVLRLNKTLKSNGRIGKSAHKAAA